MKAYAFLLRLHESPLTLLSLDSRLPKPNLILMATQLDGPGLSPHTSKEGSVLTFIIQFNRLVVNP